MIKLTKRTVIRLQWHAEMKRWVTVIAHNLIGIAPDKHSKAQLVKQIGGTLERLKDRGLLSQLIIHGKNGKIQREYTYGADPRRSKG